MTKKKVMTIEEYCLKEGKQTLLQNFMLDINPDPSKNMCCADSAICSRYSDTTFLFNFKCHICNTEWEGSGYSYIVKELTCPTCNKDSTHQKIKYASVKKGSLTLSDWCNDHEDDGQRIIDEYDDENNELTREEAFRLPYAAHTELNWKCREHGHRWSATLRNRTLKESKCPYCAGQRVSDLNSLSTWCLNNPEMGNVITNQWTGISESGKHYTMDEVSYASAIKMLWRDEYNHEWYATIANRTARNSGCPCCNNKTSYAEQFLYHGLKQIYPETENRYKAFKSDTDPYGIEYDIYVKEIDLYIEYSPTYWHNNRKERDEYKKQLCEQNNVRFIQIIEDSFNEYEELFTENYICVPTLAPSNRDEYLIKILSYILNLIGHSIKEINIESIMKNALIYSIGKIEYEKSVAYAYPEISKEIDNGMNDIKSDEITPGSNLRIKFLCPNCQYGAQGEWENTLNNRISHKLGCPACGYSCFNKDEKSNMIKIVTEGVNDLQSQYPSLAKEWHPTLNDTPPSKVKYSSSSKFNWLCPHCNYGENGEWASSLSDRIKNKSGCLRCGYNWSDGEIHKTYTSVVNEGVNDLQSQYPELVKEINTKLNNIEPSKIKYGSHIKIFWTCPNCGYGKNGEWKTKLVARIQHKSGCPACGYNCFIGEVKSNAIRVVTVGVNDLQSQCPELAKEWHPTLNDKLPSEVKYGSNIRAFWLCPYCNYGENGEWSISLYNRVHAKSGCPKCKYNWYREKYGEVPKRKSEPVKNPKKASYEQSVEFLHPELAKEWHESNTVKPSEVTANSHIRVKFICPYCNHGSKGDWENNPNNRVAQKSGCPRCHYNWHKAETNQPQNIKSQYRKPTTPSKPKTFKYVELSDIDKEMQSWDF